MNYLIDHDCPKCCNGVDPYRHKNKGGECIACDGMGVVLTEPGKDMAKLIDALIRRQHRRATTMLSVAIKEHFEKTSLLHQREP